MLFLTLLKKNSDTFLFMHSFNLLDNYLYKNNLVFIPNLVEKRTRGTRYLKAILLL